jgi:hypothetical protein
VVSTSTNQSSLQEKLVPNLCIPEHRTQSSMINCSSTAVRAIVVISFFGAVWSIVCGPETLGKTCKPATSCTSWSCRVQGGKHACVKAFKPKGKLCKGQDPCRAFSCRSGTCTPTGRQADGTVCKEEDKCYTYTCQTGTWATMCSMVALRSSNVCKALLLLCCWPGLT